MHKENEDVLRQIGHNFISEYYDALQSEPSQLYKFYDTDSMYKRHHETAVYGVDKIRELFDRDTFKYCAIKIGTIDFNAVAPWTFNVHVNGSVSIESTSNGSRNFIHNFIIKLKKKCYSDKVFYIRNEIFCFDNFAAVKKCHFPNNNLGLDISVEESNESQSAVRTIASELNQSREAQLEMMEVDLQAPQAGSREESSAENDVEMTTL